MSVPESTAASVERRIVATIDDSCGPDDTLFKWLRLHLLLDQPVRPSRRHTIDAVSELIQRVDEP